MRHLWYYYFITLHVIQTSALHHIGKYNYEAFCTFCVAGNLAKKVLLKM
jgi:hypothetical protein